VRNRNYGNLHHCRCTVPLQAIQFLAQALLPPALLFDSGARRQFLQPPDQIEPIEQHRIAGLVTAKMVHQLDGTAAPNAEDPLAAGAVDDRNLQHAQTFQDAGDIEQPLGFSGQPAGILPSLMLLHVRAN